MNTYMSISTEQAMYTDISWNDKAVLMFVLGFGANGRECFAGNEHLAKMLGMKKITVQRCVNNLVENGYLNLRKEKKRGGQQTRYLSPGSKCKLNISDGYQNDTRGEYQNDTRSSINLIPGEYQNDTVLILDTKTNTNTHTHTDSSSENSSVSHDSEQINLPLSRCEPESRGRSRLLHYPYLSLTREEAQKVIGLFKQAEINSKKKIELVLVTASAIAEEKNKPTRSFSYIRLAMEDVFKFRSAWGKHRADSSTQAPRPERRIFKGGR